MPISDTIAVMFKDSISTLLSIMKQAFASFIILILGFILLEPAISLGASATAGFTVSQNVTIELAIVAAPTNVVLAPTLGGLTGGVSNGSTQFVVKTNDHAGYQVSLMASSSLGMIGNASSSNYIPAYSPSVAGVPDYTYASTSGKANFGYTVEASTTSDVSQAFRENGTTCNTGTIHTNPNVCWIGATSTQFMIVNRNIPTPPNGATTTIKFRVAIVGTPNPVLPDDIYTATMTLTMTSK